MSLGTEAEDLGHFYDEAIDRPEGDLTSPAVSASSEEQQETRAKPPGKSVSVPQEGSIAAPVDKVAVLAMVDQLAAEDEAAQKQSVLAIAPSEDVVSWTTTISEWLQTAVELPVSIAELSCGLEMPWVEVWLGVLFGGFQVEQRGEFYESPVWVKCFDDRR